MLRWNCYMYHWHAMVINRKSPLQGTLQRFYGTLYMLSIRRSILLSQLYRYRTWSVIACSCLVQKNWNLYPRNKLHAIPRFLTVFGCMHGRARFQVTTKDSLFAFKGWMFESKDWVLEMTSAKYHIHIELLNVWKNSWNIWSDEQDY